MPQTAAVPAGNLGDATRFAAILDDVPSIRTPPWPAAGGGATITILDMGDDRIVDDPDSSPLSTVASVSF